MLDAAPARTRGLDGRRVFEQGARVRALQGLVYSALFAGELAASYAPELRGPLGVAAVVPVQGAERQALQFIGNLSEANGIVVSMVEAFHAAYPKVRRYASLTPEVLAEAPVVDQKCDVTANVLEFAATSCLAHNPVPINPRDGDDLLTRTLLQPSGRRLPLLVIQGTADELVFQLSHRCVRQQGRARRRHRRLPP